MPTNNNIDVSIIIVNFNTLKITTECINSINNFTKGINYEIIVVDNNSTEKPDQIETLPNTQLIKNKVNEGFGRANNIGMTVSRGSFILLLNSDCILEDNAIEASLKKFIDLKNGKTPNIGVLGAKLTNQDGSQNTSYFFNRISLFSLFLNNSIILKRFKRNYTSAKLKNDTQVDAVSGAFMFLSKEVFEKTKGFDPDFFLYSEETEWCFNRITPHYSIIYTPHIKVTHLVGGSSKGIKDKIISQSILSGYLHLYKKSFWIFSIAILMLPMKLLNIMFIPFLKPENRRKELLNIGEVFMIYSYIWEIMKFPSAWGSRKYPLKLKSLSNTQVS